MLLFPPRPHPLYCHHHNSPNMCVTSQKICKAMNGFMNVTMMKKTVNKAIIKYKVQKKVQTEASKLKYKRRNDIDKIRRRNRLL